MSSASRPTRALVSRTALLHNLRLLKSVTRTPVMAVVKADAYGHTQDLVAPWLQKAGVRSFGVATLEEGVRLRQRGIRGEVMILGALDLKHLPVAAAHRIGITAWSRHYLEAASRYALDIHLKVDTGMSRLGFFPSEVTGVLGDFQNGRFGRLRLASAYTHFACADERRDTNSKAQLAAFLALPWPVGLKLHASNSAAGLRYPAARLDQVRSGIFLYGAQDIAHAAAKRQKPVLSFSTQVLRVAEISKGQGVSYGHTFKAPRKMRIATLAAGYADGVPRMLSNKADVLIHGEKCRVTGRICMDLMMVDVSKAKRAKAGDEAVLIGQQGKRQVRALDWAAICQTNSYEMLCGISPRVPRVAA